MKNLIFIVPLILISGCAGIEKSTSLDSSANVGGVRSVGMDLPPSTYSSLPTNNSGNPRGATPISYYGAEISADYKIVDSDKDFVFAINADLISDHRSIEGMDVEVKFNGKTKKCNSPGPRIYCRVGLYGDLGIYPSPGAVNYLTVAYTSPGFAGIKEYGATITHDKIFSFAFTRRDNIVLYNEPNLRSISKIRLSQKKQVILVRGKSDGPFSRIFYNGSFYWMLTSMIEAGS